MNLTTTRTMLRHTRNKCLLIIPRRYLFVPSNSLTDSKKKNVIRAKPRVKSTPKIMEDEAHQKKPQIDKSLIAKAKKDLRELRSLAKDVSEYIEPKDIDSLTTTKKISTELPPIDIDEATEDIFQEISDLKGKMKKHPKALPPSLSFPEKINQRLGLVSDLLVLRESTSNLPEKTRNDKWNILLTQLNAAGGFKELSEVDIRLFVNKIPLRSLRNLIPFIENMYHEAGVSVHYNTYYSFIRALSLGASISDTQIQVIEGYFNEIEKQTELKMDHYETKIAVYVKNKNKKKIEEVLGVMKAKNLPLLKSIYKSILSSYVYYTKDHHRAIEVFDSMKFLSESTKPDAKVYAQIIISCMMNDDIDKGLDLLQEMRDNNVKPNQSILSALAKGCARSRQHKFQAWNHLFQIYEYGWTPTLQTFEHMLYISAKDGDVELTRALFYKMLETNSVTPSAFISLMLAYANYQSPTSRTEPFLVSLTENGRLFKQNIMANVDFSKPIHGFPFLPTSRIPDGKFILAESSAIWAYTIMHNPSFVNNPHVAAPYLNIAYELGEFNDFKDRLNESTYLNDEGIPKVREIEIIEPNEETKSPDSELQVVEPNENDTGLVKSPILNKLLGHLKDNRHKAPRDSMIYQIALDAAGKFKKFDFAQEIIKERGQFRKSNMFKKLSSKEQTKQDFQFAEKLVYCYVKMNLIEDAYSVVLLSVDRFPWGWKQLVPLNTAAINLGSSELAAAVRKIAQSNQVKHHGKIKSNDYKKYVMKRGY